AIGAALGGAGGSAVGADKRSRGEAAIGGALGAAGGNAVGRSMGGSTGSLIGAAAGGGAGGALGNYMGNKSDDDDRRARSRDHRRYDRDDHRGSGHVYGHRKNKHHFRHR
ncbi:glycine zipper domain-containing protein, partial [Pseudomonas viridiflava]|uniref:glycine zipper domain-containing protein n=1 Tax=Pseudomonas viridiflava TaxID=33069 RepID=UPI000F02E2FB